MKLAEVEESRLEAAREPRLDVRDPGLLPEDRLCMLPERLGQGREGEDTEWVGRPELPPKSTTCTENATSHQTLLTVSRVDHASPFH